MRGFSMDHLLAPLELLLLDTEHSEKLLTSIGIGDGGNEVGMGKVLDRVVASTVPNAVDIACTVAADHLLVCSVSNWGGYALAGAFAATYHESVLSGAIPPALTTPNNDEVSENTSTTPVLVSAVDLLSTPEEQTNACTMLVAAGARDGITKKQELYIDGMTLEASLSVLTDLNAIVIGYINSTCTESAAPVV